MRFIRAILLLVPLAASLSLAAETPGNPVGIDFSFAGFQGGGHAIPEVPAKLSVRPSGGDDTALLQSAINQVAELPVGPDGFRGAVLLRPGRFLIQGQLHLNASGVVLRGSGTGSNGTVIVATGNSRRTLIQVGGEGDPSSIPPSTPAILKVQPGDRKLPVESTDGLTVAPTS